MSPHLTLAYFTAIILASPHASESRVRAEDQDTSAASFAPIRKAWAARETAFARARFEWTEKDTYLKGMTLRLTGFDYPPADVTYKLTSSLCVNGGDLRYEAKGIQYSGRVEAFVPMTKVVAFFKSINRSF
jgi:hypothetical protein